MSDIVIRPLEQSDHAEWRRLWVAYLKFYNTILPAETFELTWKRLFTPGEYEPRGFIALLDSKPVGLTHYMYHRSCWRRPTIAICRTCSPTRTSAARAWVRR